MSYSAFAKFYDTLTANVNYSGNALFIKNILNACGISGGRILDLACGSGKIAGELAALGFDVTGIDASPEMLSLAANRLLDKFPNTQLLCSGLEDSSPFPAATAAICTLDSINHIESADKVQAIFKKLGKAVTKNGIFIFDVNTEYKCREILADNIFVYETDEVFCVWQNSFNKKDLSVDISLDFFTVKGKLYERFYEDFREYFYSDKEISLWLKSADFEILGRYDDYSSNKPVKKTQRITYVARKVE